MKKKITQCTASGQWRRWRPRQYYKVDNYKVDRTKGRCLLLAINENKRSWQMTVHETANPQIKDG